MTIDLYNPDLNLPPEGETGLIEEPLDGLRACCSEIPDGDIVRDRTVWARHMLSTGISMVDLSQFVRIKDQTGPSCTSNAAVGSYETVCRYAGYDVPILSAASVFAFVGGRGGSTVQDNFRRLQEVGCVPETMWPSSNIWSSRKPAGFDEEAAKYRLAEADWVPDFEAGTWMILRGSPVLFGVQWGRGGHAIFGVAVVKDRTGWGWKISNSWSTAWGTEGFGVLYEKQIASGIKNRYGAAAFRAPTHLPTR
jgi:hypothetical protein